MRAGWLATSMPSVRTFVARYSVQRPVRMGTWHPRSSTWSAERRSSPPNAGLATDNPSILLHAGIADRRSWYGVAEALQPQHSVVAYDMRGYGETTAVTYGFTHLDDLRAVLDQVATGPVWLVGSSMGGELAIDAALSDPERVAGLVLLAPAVSGAPEPMEFDEHTDRLVQLWEAAQTSGDIDEINRIEMWLWLDGPSAPEGRVSGACARARDRDECGRAQERDPRGVRARAASPRGRGSRRSACR